MGKNLELTAKETTFLASMNLKSDSYSEKYGCDPCDACGKDACDDCSGWPNEFKYTH